ncbi:MAG: type II toxin-antitoxin system VapC family toxin [Candidatus Woesearchaeota archaeon]
MKTKTRKRIKKKWENLPRYFVDSSVFLELAFKQHRDKACVKFFNLVGFKYRIETSSIVLGEIVKAFTKVEDYKTKDELFLWLNDILERRKISIHTVSKACLPLSIDLLNEESRIGPVDSLILSSCIDTGCYSFVTLDSGFSESFGNNYGVRIINPSLSP